MTISPDWRFMLRHPAHVIALAWAAAWRPAPGTFGYGAATVRVVAGAGLELRHFGLVAAAVACAGCWAR